MNTNEYITEISELLERLANVYEEYAEICELKAHKTLLELSQLDV